jgi:hypothetical protein
VRTGRCAMVASFVGMKAVTVRARPWGKFSAPDNPEARAGPYNVR